MTQEFYFDWRWNLQSSPQAIWPLASDTNRFNRDTGQPEIEMLDNIKGVKHARMKMPIIKVEWEEEPFEWTYPYSFGILRRYRKGPTEEMRVRANLDPSAEGGTCIRYQTWIKTSNIFAQVAVPFVIGVIAKSRFEKVFRLYDRLAKKGGFVAESSRSRGLTAEVHARFKSLSQAIVQQDTDPPLVARLGDFLARADELSAQRIRPYALADRWGVERRAVLEMFLRATRVGILDMSWDLLCPAAAPRQGTPTLETCAAARTAIPVRSISP